tara:strand:- start:335 stop:1633 length:1299 start_codon:yes stop_codon:yes gene_type:complete
MKEILIDSSKLNSWLNARKFTIDNFFQNKKNLKKKLKNKDYFHCNYKDVEFITKKLNIDTKEIIKVKQVPEYILWNKKFIESTKRPIKRDGIHFYNYYSLPSPDNFKSPVILDILCPKTKIPKLNNGHLEQAITVVLGPGDIYGRWGKKKKSSNFKKININKEKITNWIVGDTYLEPTYLPHTYSLASNTPSKILSYTAKSPIEKFIRNFNNWSKKSYVNFSKKISNKNILETIFKEILNERFVDLKYLKQLLGIKKINIKTIVNNRKYLEKICNLFDIDQSLFIKKNYKEDDVGKTYMSIKESTKLKRKYKNYEIAPMASSIRYPDLYGTFIKVYKNISKTNLLNIFNCHYLVTSGQLFFITNKKKLIVSEGDCLWVSPYINHGFSGKGSLIRISNGESLDNQDLNEISNLYKPKQTLTRSYGDKQVWGYE